MRWVGCLHCVYWGETEATGEEGERTEERELKRRGREVARKEGEVKKRLLGRRKGREERSDRGGGVRDERERLRCRLVQHDTLGNTKT